MKANLTHRTWRLTRRVDELLIAYDLLIVSPDNSALNATSLYHLRNNLLFYVNDAI